MIRLVGLQQLFVNGDRIVESRGKRMFGRQAIEHRDDFGPGQVGDGDGLGQRTGIGIEAAAVQINQNAVAFFWRDCEWRNDSHWNSGDDVSSEVHRIDFLGCFTSAGLPFVGAGAALLQRLRHSCVRFHTRQYSLRLEADGGGHRHNARDIGCAVLRDGAAV